MISLQFKQHDNNSTKTANVHNLNTKNETEIQSAQVASEKGVQMETRGRSTTARTNRSSRQEKLEENFRGNENAELHPMLAQVEQDPTTRSYQRSMERRRR